MSVIELEVVDHTAERETAFSLFGKLCAEYGDSSVLKVIEKATEIKPRVVLGWMESRQSLSSGSQKQVLACLRDRRLFAGLIKLPPPTILPQPAAAPEPALQASKAEFQPYPKPPINPSPRSRAAVAARIIANRKYLCATYARLVADGLLLPDQSFE